MIQEFNWKVIEVTDKLIDIKLFFTKHDYVSYDPSERDNLIVKIKTSEFRDKENNKTAEFTQSDSQRRVARQYPPGVDVEALESTVETATQGVQTVLLFQSIVTTLL